MPDTLAAALAEVQTNLPAIDKGHTARVTTDKATFTYDYADLADVTEAIVPLLAKAGLSWTCRPTLTGDTFVLEYELLHVSGESKVGAYPLPKTGTPQAMGAAISYARRYALCAVTGVAPKGDDNDAADQPKTRTAQRARPTQPQPAATAAPRPTAQRANVDGPPLPGDDGVTPKQVNMIGALMGQVGMTDRDLALEFVASVIGRPVESRNDLTKREASQVIDELQKQAAPVPPADVPDPHDGQDPWATT